MVLAMADAPSTHSQPFTRVDLAGERFERAGTPSFWVVDPVGGSARARFTAWQLGEDGRYRTIVDIVDASRFHASSPYPVTVVPGALVG
ncbi:MAG: hypothetical protein V7603_3447 [Micromonosporaceae bacterium]